MLRTQILSHYPNVPVDDDANEDTMHESDKEIINEDAYMEVLGTRPALPKREFEPGFLPIIGVFACCTETDYKKRPNANQVVKAFEPIAIGLKITFQ